jgi:amphi-Trp domain-containing protein
MTEQTLFAFERDTDTAEVARYLRTIADHLESGDECTLESGTESVTITVPGRVEFEVTVEREPSTAGGPAEMELALELEWAENGDETAALDIG